MTASLTNKQTIALNRMNRAAQNVQLGTMLNDLGFVATGSYTVTAADMNGSRVAVSTGLSSVGGMVALATRSGSPTEFKFTSGSVPGTIVVENCPTVSACKITTGDVVSYVAFM